MLPDFAKTPWPPTSWQPHQTDILTADAWYSGDPARLRARSSSPPNQRKFRFWGRGATTDKVQTDQGLHVPAAADIAALGADLLFGETPAFEIAAAHNETPDPVAIACEGRLTELAYIDGWSSLLLEAAEVGGALGGVYLRPVIDPHIADHPLLTVVHPDCAVPEFHYGHMVAVTFWQQWDADEPGKVWRHLERHSPGIVEHGLYLGTATELGPRRSLMDFDRTAPFARTADGSVGDGIVDFTQWGVTSVPSRYIPNSLPNPKRRKDPVGRPDTAGVEPLMDALDETWASWVRDIRLAKARLIVPDEFLDHRGRGVGDTFDVDREIFAPLSMDPASTDKAGITPVQFAIRVTEHEATARALFTEITQRAGYSPQSFGQLGGGSEQTATEVDAREGRSARTTSKKRGYWQRPMEDIAEMVLQLDAALFGSGITPMRPKLEWPSDERDPLAEAQTLSALALARAVSTETMVRMLHPDWAPELVAAEVNAIETGGAVQVDDPMGGMA